MIAHVAQKLFPEARLVPPPVLDAKAPRRQGGQVLGMLSPMPDAGADALIVDLARALRRRGDPALLVVFGRCLDDLAVMAPGNVFVTGAMEQEDIATRIGLYEITEIMSCSRTRFGARLDALASTHGLARASFDWSSGALAFDRADLALDPRLCDRKTAELVADWLGQRRRTAQPAAGTAKKVKAR
jgi:hypothetical protein